MPNSRTSLPVTCLIVLAIASALPPLRAQTPPLNPMPTAEVVPLKGTADTRTMIEEALKKDADKKKAAEEAKKAEAQAKKDYELYGSSRFDLQSLYDSLSVPAAGEKKWYEKLSIRGYTQVRFGRTLDTQEGTPNLFGDRTINGTSENFLIRRARLILFGDISDHLSLYFQPDFAVTPQGSTNAIYFAQLRDLYADVYLDATRVHRLRVGLSKVPYGFENMQSSQNRVPLDRTDAMNSAVAPNERDIGVFYYWTPEEYQKLFATLVRGGLKGSGNYGVFAFGVYDGQGGSVAEANLNLHMVSRVTLPMQLGNGQIVEASLQGYRGDYVVAGSAIRPLGQGSAGVVPTGTGGTRGILEERIAATLVWYPQPFGFQAEWQTGRGPGLNEAQTAVGVRHIHGGYVMGMFRHETARYGIFTPYCRYQQYTGGYRNIANAPFGRQRQTDFGVEWQISKQLELVLEYSTINSPNFTALNATGASSYRDFEGSALRTQLQFNY